MNFHMLFDSLSAGVGAVAAGKNKYFSQDIKSCSFSEHLNNTTMELSEFKRKGKYVVEAETPCGTLETAFLIYQWKESNDATIIYHHGNNESPFDFGMFSKNSFKDIFVKNKESINANLIAVRAPFHDSSLREYKKKITKISNFMAMLSVSVILIDKLTSYINENYNNQIIVSGISLGGWVTNLHRTYFNTADNYVPLLAGAALGDLFINSKYNKLTGKIAKNNPEKILKLLNFTEDFKKIDSNNIYPLLGRYDQFIQYDVQKECYTEQNIKVLDKGHITTFLVPGVLKDHIMSAVKS